MAPTREHWPAWATAPIEIVDADPGWRRQGKLLCDELRAALARWLTDRVHHVGSTAVPGLPAKPIVDFMAGVGDLSLAGEVAGALAPHGWEYVPPDLDQRDWRRFFVLVRGDRRVAHLHVMVPHTPRWRAQLAFRDRLRARPDLRDEYARLKRELSQRHREDREAYTNAKSAFVERVIAGLDLG